MCWTAKLLPQLGDPTRFAAAAAAAVCCDVPCHEKPWPHSLSHILKALLGLTDLFFFVFLKIFRSCVV